MASGHLTQHLPELAGIPVAGVSAAVCAPIAVRCRVAVLIALIGSLIRGPIGGRLQALQTLIDALPLLLDDVGYALLDILEHGGEVVPFEVALLRIAEALQKVLHTHPALALRPLDPVLHHAPERAAQVVALQNLLGEFVEQILRRRKRDVLRAVPSGIAVDSHERSLGAPARTVNASHPRRVAPPSFPRRREPRIPPPSFPRRREPRIPSPCPDTSLVAPAHDS